MPNIVRDVDTLTPEEMEAAEQLLNSLETDAALAEKRVVETAPRGATEGPLATLRPIFLDFESTITSEITLKKMTLRQYLDAAEVESMAICIGDDKPLMYFTEHVPGLHAGARLLDANCRAALISLAQDPTYVWVAHNAAFDIRCARRKLGIPQPANVWCTLEGAMGAWPELPGGYSLDNCTRRIGMPNHLRKFKIDLTELGQLRSKILLGKKVRLRDLNEDFCTEICRIAKLGKIDIPEILDIQFVNQILEIYNVQDVISLRELFYRQAARLPACEQETALRTHHQRQHHFLINPDRLRTLIHTLDSNAHYAEKEASEYVDEEQTRDIFNRETDDGSLRSVRYKRLKDVINALKDDEDDFDSTSLKKLSPIKLARNPTVHALLEQTTRAGKMLSHRRRAAVFIGVDEVDCELGYMRAHTGRFSSPSVGKGLNLHNCPKHDKAVAEPIRKCYRLPPDKCFVRADLANVEYRIEGMITECRNVMRMFDEALGGNVFNDPYCLSWKAMTGILIDKASPIRQVAKSAVLGLGFCMGVVGYARVLLGVLAGKSVTEEDLRKIIQTNRWRTPSAKVIDRVRRMLGCSTTVTTAAFHIHRAFNEAHPEFSITANWIVSAVDRVAACPEGPPGRDMAKRVLDSMYSKPAAPNRDLIGLEIDDDPVPRKACIRVRCGPWAPTVCWREPHSRPTNFQGGAQDYKLTILKAAGFPKPFTRQLAIENVTQAAARNALCLGLERLDRRHAQRDVLHIHDEALVITDRNRKAVLAAREALLNTFGPGHDLPHKWAILVKPDEVTVTESLYESEADIAPIEKGGNDRWGKIERNEEGCLLNLP